MAACRPFAPTRNITYLGKPPVRAERHAQDRACVAGEGARQSPVAGSRRAGQAGEATRRAVWGPASGGGADHPQTLVARNNLAVAYEPAKDLGRATPLYEQTPADSVRVLGAGHPQTKIVSGSPARARQHPQ
jgi:hypothetical protein